MKPQRLGNVSIPDEELIKDNVRRSDLVALEKRRCILAASILTEGITYRLVR